MGKDVSWSILLMNMYVDPYQLSCRYQFHLWNRYLYKLSMCQEPDLNWWHEDFQSSALPAELSRPSLTHHPHFNIGLGSMSIKKTKGELQSLIQALLEFLGSSKKDFVSFSTVRVIKWIFNYSNLTLGFFSQRCSFVRLSYRSQGLW